MRPAARSCTAIDGSRYGTCFISSFSSARNALKMTSGRPGVAAHNSRPGWWRASAATSASDEPLRVLVAAMPIDAVTTAAVGTRSRTGSKGRRSCRRGLSVTCPAGVKISVCPSFADANTCTPTIPSAPGRLSTTTGCRQRSDSRGARRRATRSLPVPGPNGTITVTGRVGHWVEPERRAQAPDAAMAKATRTTTGARMRQAPCQDFVRSPCRTGRRRPAPGRTCS